MPNLAKIDVLEQLTTAVVVVNNRLQVCYINPAAEAVFGTSEQHCAGAELSELFMGAAGILARLEETFATGQSVTERAAEFALRDGTTVVADLTASLDPLSDRLVIELVPMNRLLRINRDDHSVFSQETTRKLVRGLAHEIKNPLGGIRGAAQLLERELERPELREYTRVIIDEADRLGHLVDRMLGPIQEPKPAGVNVHAVLEHVIRLVDAELPGRISFERDYDPSLPEIWGDEEQLVQALLNIIRNAGQALTDGATAEPGADPRIVVRTRAVRQFTIGRVRHRLTAQIDVIDNGPGIPPDMTERIWYPMISGRADGTGLGLAITQNIVGQHGGVIECESQPGRTCFSVFLPLRGNQQGSESP